MKISRPFARGGDARRHALRGVIVRRALGLGALLSAGMVIYVVVFGMLYSTENPVEQVFSEAGAVSPFNIYVTLIDIDPVREELMVHLDFATIEGPHGQHYPGVPDRDLLVHVGDGNSVQDITLPAKRSAPPATVRVSLRGLVSNYPFDTYAGRIWVSAAEAVTHGTQPVRLTVWPVMSRWTVRLVGTPPDPPNPSELGLDIRIVRPAPFVVIAIAVYAAMALVGLSALTIGSLVFLGVRRLEATLTGTLAAMVFAVPALRGALPGVPPLGGHADVLVFVWVQLAVIIALTLFVITWARRGPTPERPRRKLHMSRDDPRERS